MSIGWLDEEVKINGEVLQSTLSLYFEKNVKGDSNTSTHLLTDKEKKYIIKLFASKLLDCKKCCKKCPEKTLSYRDIFHILYEIYSKVDVNDDGTVECYTITSFLYKYNTEKYILEVNKN